MEMKDLSKNVNPYTTRIKGLWILAFDCESDSAEDLELKRLLGVEFLIKTCKLLIDGRQQ